MKHSNRKLLTCIGMALMASSVPAQSFNVDMDRFDNVITAPNSYTAGGLQNGLWNSFTDIPSLDILSVSGQATAISLSIVNFQGNGLFSPGVPAPDSEMYSDFALLNPNKTYTFTGLIPGEYTVHVHSYHPPTNGVWRTQIRVDGSNEGVQELGASFWPGAPQAGLTYSTHTISFQSTGTLLIRGRAANPVGGVGGAVNGIQVVRTGDVCAGVRYCFPPELNSLGLASFISCSGSDSIAANNLTLTGNLLVPNQPAFFVIGSGNAVVSLPFGRLCVSGGLARMPVGITSPSPNSIFSFTVDYNNMPAGAPTISPGTTTYWQLFQRDPQGVGGGSLTDAMAVTHIP
ncbi:MAG: hypothetical protein ABGY71_12065 [bacterium]|jgi:hypothetical protein|nr:hypothetical protein [Planctomycetota bacterium]HIL51061.1 hypothetical protein [Planctomycetota bacterium]